MSLSVCTIQLDRDRGEYQKACAEIDEVSERLSNAVSDSILQIFYLIMYPLSLSQARTKFENYGEIMVKFGLDLFKDQPRKDNN